MSYAVKRNPDAVAALSSLDVAFAESILDEIDRIADDPSEFNLERAYPFVGYDQKYIFRVTNRIVTLFIRIDESTQTLIVQNIAFQGD